MVIPAIAFANCRLPNKKWLKSDLLSDPNHLIPRGMFLCALGLTVLKTGIVHHALQIVFQFFRDQHLLLDHLHHVNHLIVH
jgi:hypothetical protein